MIKIKHGAQTGASRIKQQRHLLVFGIVRVRIPAVTPVILNDVFRGFLQSLKQPQRTVHTFHTPPNRQSPIVLSSSSGLIFEKLTVCQLVKKFPAFHGTSAFITAFTTDRHRVPYSEPINSIHTLLPYFFHIRFHFILPVHVPLCPMRATCSAISSSLIRHSNFWRRAQIMALLLRQFSHHTVTLFLISELCHPLLEALSTGQGCPTWGAGKGQGATTVIIGWFPASRVGHRLFRASLNVTPQSTPTQSNRHIHMLLDFSL
jgi:hypothetical protein